MKVSFGSTYAIRFNYEKHPFPEKKRTYYQCSNRETNDFIEDFTSIYKGKNDISAINPAKQMYYISVNGRMDEFVEYMTTHIYPTVNIKKVNKEELENAQITSVGRKRNEDLKISNIICSYECNKLTDN